jgi:hypothetical protein
MAVGLDRIFKDGFATAKTYWIGTAVVVTAGVGIAGHFSMTARDDLSTVQAVAAMGSPLVRLEPLSARPTFGANVLAADGRPARPSDLVSLAQALQAGLARAECYDGPINGIWTTKSKDAMRKFTTAVNAQLPVDVPDQSLLALVESNQAAKCLAAPPAPAGAGVAAPSFVSADMQQHVQTRPDATASRQSSMSPTSGVDKNADTTIEHVSSSSEVIVPPIKMETDREAVASSNEGEVEPDRQTKSRSAAQQYNKASQHQTRFKKPTTVGDLSKSITKSVKSIKRTLASFFY